MDQIAQQLRTEIHSLEQHIKRTGNRLLVAKWVDEMVGPFEQIENSLDTSDLRAAIVAFHHARNHFKVNGHLADRIDEILARHEGLVADLDRAPINVSGADEYDAVVLSPDSDPGDTTAGDEAGSLFFDEDEELVDNPAAADTSGDSAATIDFGRDVEALEPTLDFGGRTGLDEPSGTIDFGRDEDILGDAPAIEFTGLNDLGTDKTVDVDFGRASEAPDAKVDSATDLDGGSDELFSTTDPKGSGEGAPGTSLSSKGRTPDDKSRDSSLSAPSGKEDPSLYAIFAHTISIDDLAAGLDIVISPQDRTFLDQKLRARLSDRVVAALRANKASEKHYILVPRIARATNAGGATLPLTVKNMAKRYTSLFGDIRDLMRYRNDNMMSIEVPEPGWSIISAESPRESLGKNYMEQNQYLRYVATSLSLPSHLVRRRTMVEAIYDMIVGELVLGKHLQRASLDWTSSTPAKNDYVCVYYPDEGIRVRDLSRVTHHRSLGVNPNW